MTATTVAPADPVTSLWLEITGRCQVACTHCYADSSPQGDHGAMTVTDWRAVLDEAAEQGVRMVQFIGGEPTLHPDLPDLVAYALAAGIAVEIYTNLLHVPDRLWEVFSLPGVRLATSYYSADPAQHEAVTGRRGSHERTRANIAETIHRGIPLRVGLIDTGVGGVDAARADLDALGVVDVSVDRVRAFSRAAVGEMDMADTCGRCGRGRAAVGPDGTVTPCVFTRHAVAGNVRTSGLGKILTGQRWREVLDAVPRPRAGITPCKPDGDTRPCGPVHPEPDPNQ